MTQNSNANNSYDKAVSLFDQLIHKVVEHPYVGKASIARDCGIPGTSCDRLLGSLEAGGFLAKDASGEWIRSQEMQHLGLKAWGLGELSYALEPVLDRLRRDTDKTAFIGVRQKNPLLNDPFFFGPFSIGQGQHYVYPQNLQQYRVRVLPLENHSNKTPVQATHLEFFLSTDPRKYHQLLRAICLPLINKENGHQENSNKANGDTAMIGILLPEGVGYGDTEDMEYLQLSRERLLQKTVEDQSACSNSGKISNKSPTKP